MKYPKLLFLCLLLSTFAVAENLTLETILNDANLRPKGIEQINSMNERGFYTTLVGSSKLVKSSYQDPSYKKVLFDLKESGIKARSIGSYQFSDDDQKLLISVNHQGIYRHSFQAQYYVVDLSSQKAIQVAKGENIQMATFSPNAKRVAYVKAHNLYYMEVENLKETQITTDGLSNKIINGLPDWVYEEEFSFNKAYEWSPNGKQIAYLKFDESKVDMHNMMMFGTEEELSSVYSFKYPRAGTTNSTVGVWVYDLESQQNQELEVGKENDQYIPRIKWSKEAERLLILRLNRLQNKLDYLLANTQSHELTPVLTEENKRFVDARNFDFIHFVGKDSFLYVSEKSGFNHPYLFNYKTRKELALFDTNSQMELTDLYGVNPEETALFCQLVTDSPLDRVIAQVDFKKKIHFLTPKEGFNTASFDKSFTFFIDIYSDLNTPPIYTINSKKRAKRVLEDNSLLKKHLTRFSLPSKEFTTFHSAQEGVSLNAWILKPSHFDPKKSYPLLITQYSGPNSQNVQNKWEFGWHEYLAEQEGFVVVCVDPHGTGARGEEFRKQTYMELGKLESEDLIAVAKQLGKEPYIDSQKLAIWGWSYGGFMSSLCLLKGNDVFAAAIAVAPVTSWRYYDTVYTERYMRTPQENPKGYDDNSPLFHADKLKGNLLLIHGTADDNVHVENSHDLSVALTTAGKDFQLKYYPDKAHGIRGAKTRMHLYTLMTDFLLNQVK